MSDMLRITGMATGLDVDTIVTKMMAAENIRVDTVKQDKQVLQWTQDAFRDIIGSINTLKSTYFDYTKPESNMLSSNTYAAFDVSSSDSAAVTAAASISAAAGSYSVTVDQLASAASKSGISINSQVEVGDLSNWAGKSLTIQMGTTTQVINISSSDSNLDQLVGDINQQIGTNSTLSSNLSVSYTIDSSGRQFVKFNNLTGNTMQITGTTIVDPNTDGQKSIANLVGKNLISSAASTKLSDLGVVSADLKLNIAYNGTSTAIDVDNSSGTKTINDVITAIASQTGGKVLAKFDEITGSFTIQTSGTGSGSVLMVNGSTIGGVPDNTLLNALGLSVDTVPNQGRDARVKITTPDGVTTTVTQSKNNFLLNGMNYNLMKSSISTSIAGGSTNVTSLSTSSESLNGLYIVKQYTAADNVVGDAITSTNASGGTGSVGGTFTGAEDTKYKVRITSVGLNGEVTGVDVSTSTDDGTTWSNWTSASGDGSSPTNFSLVNGLTFQVSDNLQNAVDDIYSFSSSAEKVDFSLNSKQDGTGVQYGNSVTVHNNQTTAVIGDPNLDKTASIVFNFNAIKADSLGGTLVSDQISETVQSPVVVSVKSNSQKTFDKIKAFIDKYNDLINTIDTQITQKKQYDYKPLTDDQKKNMKESEITAWEAKAKEGLLKNDSNLENMLYSMRSAFYDSVKDAGISLSQIGLSTSNDYTQNGKIIIDETKLKEAIQNNGTQVADLFMKSSTTPYDPDIHSTVRYNEEGIFQRINDIIQDYTRTTRDKDGNKGVLIEKAGIKGDLSEFKNMLSDEMNDKDDMISELAQKLVDKQNRYYQQFSQLEVAMQQMNDQQNWLTQQLSAMSGGA